MVAGKLFNLILLHNARLQEKLSLMILLITLLTWNPRTKFYLTFLFYSLCICQYSIINRLQKFKLDWASHLRMLKPTRDRDVYNPEAQDGSRGGLGTVKWSLYWTSYPLEFLCCVELCFYFSLFLWYIEVASFSILIVCLSWKVLRKTFIILVGSYRIVFCEKDFVTILLLFNDVIALCWVSHATKIQIWTCLHTYQIKWVFFACI